MKSLKFKNTMSGYHSLTSPFSPIGKIRKFLHVVEIYDIPETVPAHEVLRLLNYTTEVTAKNPDGSRRYRFKFSELGVGKIIF
jgi:hypothetical protein